MEKTQAPDFNKERSDTKNAPINAANASINVENAPINVVDLSLTSLQQKLLEILQTHPTISDESLAKELIKDHSTIVRNIKKLKQLGLLKRIGARKKGYWEVFLI